MSPNTLEVNRQPIKETGIRSWHRIRSLGDIRGPNICLGSNKSKMGAKLDPFRETTIKVRFKTYQTRSPLVCYNLQAQLTERDLWLRSRSSQTNLDITWLIWARWDLVKMTRYSSLIVATIPFIRPGITSKLSLLEMTQIQIFWRLIWIKAGKWLTTMVEPNLRRTISDVLDRIPKLKTINKEARIRYNPTQLCWLRERTEIYNMNSFRETVKKSSRQISRTKAT